MTARPLLAQPIDIAAILATAAAVAHPRPVNLDDYVRRTFDGEVGDCELPFRDQDQARLAVEAQLTERAGRPLSEWECSRIRLAVAIEWNGRVACAKLEAFRGIAMAVEG